MNTQFEAGQTVYSIHGEAASFVAQTSSGARETTKAADQLSELASDLNAIVKQFKV